MSALVLDTSVLVEFAIADSRFRRELELLQKEVVQGVFQVHMPATSVGEALYVVARLFRAARASTPNQLAQQFVHMMLQRLRVRVQPVTSTIALQAGELRKQLRISFLDCVVLATAQQINATPVFLRIEKEMQLHESLLRELGLKTLEEVVKLGHKTGTK